MATKLSEMLCFAWAGDFECLKQFVGENLKLEGSWTQPGGDKKMFTSDNSTIIWRKNKNLLCLSERCQERIVQTHVQTRRGDFSRSAIKHAECL